ncbi:hypothetical protein FHK92_27515 [Pseudomonas brassicacearum subsp. neoaurantiaca]|uniref:Uncharacterized protein n=1 Tax=Pseudomonas brassicacearum subsp. neoaurantiaca TaxID=494916 RepID=A0A7V8UH70_9PSED|nr:hypothetical protein [Pseudomonas brassicacearum subsp. neoaurantiaca]
MVDIPKRPVAGMTGKMRCLTQSSGITPNLWERACSRKGLQTEHLCWLIDRFREQARSHTGHN